MRTLCCLAFASVVAAAAGAVPAPAFATDPPQTVRIDQVARRTIGRCVYTTTLRGSYSLADGGTVRNAVVDVDSQVACHGERPVASSREVYFATTTEPELLARVGELATVDNPSRHGGACSFRPTVARQGGTVGVTDVAYACSRGAEPVATRGDARRATPLAHR